MGKRFWFAVFAALIICLAIMWFASITSDAITDAQATQTQFSQLQTWDAELHSDQ